MAQTVRRLIAMDGAMLTMRESELMVGGTDRPIDIPVPTFLIEHPKGLVLFDTGCNPGVAVDAQGCWGKVADYLKVRFSPDLVVDSQICRHGYRPEDVKYVVVSHLHLDHAGGLALFPGARFFIMKGELNYAWWPERRHRAAFRLNDLMPTRRFDWVELEGDTDLFQDGSLTMLRTPGHTPGEASLMVRLHGERPILLTGDTVHLRGQLDRLAPSAMDFDPVQASESLARLRRIRDLNEARVWVMHDPEDWAAFPHVVE